MTDKDVQNNNHSQIPPSTPQISFQFSSPLPPPPILEQYKYIGLMDEVVNLIKIQADHRRNIENKQIQLQENHLQSEIDHQKRRDFEAKIGQFLAFFICLASIIGGICAVISNYPLPGTVVAALGLSGIIGNFIQGRNTKT